MTGHQLTATKPPHIVSHPAYAPIAPARQPTERPEPTSSPGRRTTSDVLPATEAAMRLRLHVTKRLRRCLYNSRRLCHRLQICERRRNRRNNAPAISENLASSMPSPASTSTPLVSPPRRGRKRNAEAMMSDTRLDNRFAGEHESQQVQSYLPITPPPPVSPTRPVPTTTISPKRRRMQPALSATHAAHLIQLSGDMERESVALADRTSELRAQVGYLTTPLSSTQRRLQPALSSTTAANLLQLASDMERQSVALAERGRHLRVEITRELGTAFEDVHTQAGGVEAVLNADDGRSHVAERSAAVLPRVSEPSDDVDGACDGSQEGGEMGRTPDGGDVSGGVGAGALLISALREQAPQSFRSKVEGEPSQGS